MAKTSLQLVNFNKGLITEANPLIQPLGSTRSEQNFTIENDGKRNRRLGMDYESGAVEIDIDITDTNLIDAASSTFRWDLTGEVSGLYIIVVQLGNVINFFESTEEPLSASLLGSLTFTQNPTTEAYSMAQVNSSLIVATGKSIKLISYTDGEPPVFSSEDIILEARDFFGLEDVDPITGEHIDRSNGLSFRPPFDNAITDNLGTSPEHIYNLYNQGFPTAIAWVYSPDNFPIKDERFVIGSCIGANDYFPSNSDVYVEYVVSSTNVDPKEIKTYIPELMNSGEVRTYASPKGRFILKLLSRGERRGEVYTPPISLSDKLVYTPKQDITPDSASVVAEFAGRVFYAGFSGQVIDGDDKSPRLNNYVAFSQLIEYKQQASQCYQVADPTSEDDSEVVATDGGLIRISEATNIIGMTSVSNSLLVFAENGVWQILGGSDFGFSADNYQVVKVTERGCISPKSIVNVGEAVIYWSTDGIYLCETSDTGFFSANDITANTIKSFYEDITSKQDAVGTYDDFDKSVHWVYGGGEELVFKLSFNAWFPNVVSDDNIKIRGLVEVSPFVGGLDVDDITVLGVDVTVNGEQVVVTTGVKLNKRTEIKYLAIRPDNDTFTFSSYNDVTFVDWNSLVGFEEDADAFMQGAHFTGGSGAKAKQSPYVTFHFNKTETGFDSEFEPINPSSCLVQTSWDWSNSDNSNKQGRQFQAYRFRRHYMPADILDPFNNGFETVVSKSKVRGRGKALSVLIKTEPLKDCQLIGWEQEVTINDN